MKDLGGLTLYLQINHRELSGWILLDQDREPHLISGDIGHEDNWKLEIISGPRYGARVEGFWEDSRWEGEWSLAGESIPLELEKFLVITDLSYGRMEQIHFRSQIPHFYNRGLSSWNSKMREDALQQMAEFLTLYDSLEEEPMPWNSQSTLSFSYLSHHWVSMLEENYQFTGGAHGNTYLRSRLLHRTNQGWEELGLYDLLQNIEKIPPLAELLRKDLVEQGASWTDREEWGNNGFTTYLQDFALTPQGITFYFEQYRVGSYAEGIYEVFVPWSEDWSLWSDLVRNSWGRGNGVR